MCLYAGLDEVGDDVQVHVINTQVRERERERERSL